MGQQQRKKGGKQINDLTPNWLELMAPARVEALFAMASGGHFGDLFLAPLFPTRAFCVTQAVNKIKRLGWGGGRESYRGREVRDREQIKQVEQPVHPVCVNPLCPKHFRNETLQVYV